MTLALELLVGGLAGGHVSTWGMYKDSPHEGFTWPKYFRSTLVGLFWGPVGAWIAGIDVMTGAGIVILFGLVYALERATTEFWKTFIRDEDQSKYFIPMQFHVLGHVVKNRFTRLLIGLGFVGLAVGLLQVVRMIQPDPGVEGPLWQILLVGSIGGWYSACGGAFKDAPIEGFEWFKFFRSPVTATTYGFMASQFTTSYVLIALCGIGYTVATLETWKTFFFPNEPRGKFASKPIVYPEMLESRNYFRLYYIGIWIFVITGWSIAFTGLVNGTGGPAIPAEAAAAGEMMSEVGGVEPATIGPLEAGTLLGTLWNAGDAAFGVFVPNERERGATGPDGERLPPLYTAEGAAALSANELYDYLFLNMEGGYDAGMVADMASGVAAAERSPTLLVRIPPISRDGEEAARTRVNEIVAAGADGIVLPHVRSVEEARTALSFFEGVDVWSPENRTGSFIVMLMVEDPDAVAASAEIAALPGYSALACGIGSLTRAMDMDGEGAEVLNLEVLAHATANELADVITANSDDVADRVEDGFLGLLMGGPQADEAIQVGRAAAGR